MTSPILRTHTLLERAEIELVEDIDRRRGWCLGRARAGQRGRREADGASTSAGHDDRTRAAVLKVSAGRLLPRRGGRPRKADRARVTSTPKPEDGRVEPPLVVSIVEELRNPGLALSTDPGRDVGLVRAARVRLSQGFKFSTTAGFAIDRSRALPTRHARSVSRCTSSRS